MAQHVEQSNPEQWAHWVLAVNLIGAAALLSVAIGEIVIGLPFTVWTGGAGLVLWSYYSLRIVDIRARRGGQSVSTPKPE